MVLFFSTAIMVVIVCCLFNYNLTAIDKNDNSKIMVIIPSGASVKQIGNMLEEQGLIRNANFFYFYCKIYDVDTLKATTYELSKNMDLKKIIDVLEKGNSYNPDEISITFNEGITMRRVASIIAKRTNNNEDDVFALLKDESYLDELIANYWFITDAIKNPDIYYSLEGYLYPNTYNFKNKDVTVRDIFKTMLDETEKVLAKYETQINSSSYNVHEILTLASMVEQEAPKVDYRNKIASVFLNRLKTKMSLGSDVTAYYGSKIDMDGSTRLTTAQLNDVNPYNTRVSSMAGKLPVGPISNVSETSIKAVLEPIETDFYYFVADKNGLMYFMKTYSEHLAQINKLKKDGLWLG